MPWWRNIPLLLIYAGGLGWIAYELQRPQPSLNTEQTDSPATAYRVVSPLTFDSTIDQFDAIVQRPLFRPDRRPPSVASRPDPKTPIPPPSSDAKDIAGLRVSAVFSNPETIAALIEMNGNERKIIHRGDRIGSWKVLEIRGDQVTLGNGDNRETLRVHDFSRLPSPAKAPARRPNPRPRQTTNTAPGVNNGNRPRSPSHVRAAPAPTRRPR